MSYVEVVDKIDIPKPDKAYTEPDWVEVGGIPVAYRRKGSGEPVVFLHGGGYTRRWIPYYEEMSKKVDFIAPEHPGFGETPAPSWFRNFDDLTIHYDEFMDLLGLDKVHLIGFSMGGWAAAEFASFYPKRLKSLTLITPIGLRLLENPGVDLFQLNPSELMDRLFEDKKAQEEWMVDLDDFDEGIQMYSEAAAMARLIWAPRYNLALERRLQRLMCPTLIVGAENDRLIPNEMADRFAEVIPGANLVRKKGTGHEVCLERPEELTTACIDLISGAAR
ncbi:MAG: alpha/beta hydrolase [Alphaproteobacteria bacterium]